MIDSAQSTLLAAVGLIIILVGWFVVVVTRKRATAVHVRGLGLEIRVTPCASCRHAGSGEHRETGDGEPSAKP